MDAEAVRQPSSTSPTGPVTLAGEAPLLLPVAMSGTSSGGAVANMTHRRSGAEDDGPTASAAVSPSPQPSQQQQQVGGGAGGVGQPVDVFANAMPAEHARGRPQTSRGLSAIRALLAQLSELRTDGTIRGDSGKGRGRERGGATFDSRDASSVMSDTERLMQPGGISGRHSAERLVGGGASSTASGNGGEQSGIRRALLRELSRRTPETVEDGAGGGANGGTEAAAETNENDDETPAAAAERYRLGNNSALDLSVRTCPSPYFFCLVFFSCSSTNCKG